MVGTETGAVVGAVAGAAAGAVVAAGAAVLAGAVVAAGAAEAAVAGAGAVVGLAASTGFVGAAGGAGTAVVVAAGAHAVARAAPATAVAATRNVRRVWPGCWPFFVGVVFGMSSEFIGCLICLLFSLALLRDCSLPCDCSIDNSLAEVVAGISRDGLCGDHQRDRVFRVPGDPNYLTEVDRLFDELTVGDVQ